MPQEPVLHECLLYTLHSLPTAAGSSLDPTQIRSNRLGASPTHPRTPSPLISLSQSTQHRDCEHPLAMARDVGTEDNCLEDHTHTPNTHGPDSCNSSMARTRSLPALRHSIFSRGDDDLRASPLLTHRSMTSVPGTDSVSAVSSSTMTACPASLAPASASPLSSHSSTPILPTTSLFFLAQTSPQLPLNRSMPVDILETESLGLLSGRRASPWRLVAQLGLSEGLVDSHSIGTGIDGLAECVVARILQAHTGHPTATAPGSARSMSRTSGSSAPQFTHGTSSTLGYQAPRSLSPHLAGTSLLLSNPRGDNCLEKIKSPLPSLREPLAVRMASASAIAIAVERLEAQALREDSWLPQRTSLDSSISSPSCLEGSSRRTGTEPPPCSPRSDIPSTTSMDLGVHRPVTGNEEIEEDIIGPHMPFLPLPEGVRERYLSRKRTPLDTQQQQQQRNERQLIRIPMVSRYSLDDSQPDVEDGYAPTEMGTRLGIGDANQMTRRSLINSINKSSEATSHPDPIILDQAEAKVPGPVDPSACEPSESIYPPLRSVCSESRAGNGASRGGDHCENKDDHPLSWLMVDSPSMALGRGSRRAYVFVDAESQQIVGDIVEGPASSSEQGDSQGEGEANIRTRPEGLDIARLAAALATHRVQIGENPFMPLAHPWGPLWQQSNHLSERGQRTPSPSLRLPRPLTLSMPGLGIGIGRNGREGLVNLGYGDYDWPEPEILQDQHWCGTGRLIYSHCREEQRLRQMWPYGTPYETRTPPGWPAIRRRIVRGCNGSQNVEEGDGGERGSSEEEDVSPWPILYDADRLAETRPPQPSCTSRLRTAMRVRGEHAWPNPMRPFENLGPSDEGQGQEPRQAQGRGQKIISKRFVRRHCHRGWQLLKRASRAIVGCVTFRSTSDKNNYE